MNLLIQNLTLGLAATILAGTLTRASGQDTVFYSSGPSFSFAGAESDPAILDMDGDGAPDFSFQSGYFICTADVPTSGCSSQFYVTALESNAMLRRSSEATILKFG